MKNPIDLILENSPHQEVLLAAAGLDGVELSRLADRINESAVTTIRNYVSQVCRTTGVQATLMTGAFLDIYAAVAKEEEGPESYHDLLDEIGVSRTQAYRSRMAWNRFGKILIAEPKIRNQFVAESIKLLAATNVCDDAVEQALDLARSGTRISIKTAASIIEMHHGEPDSIDPSQGIQDTNEHENVGKISASPRLTVPKEDRDAEPIGDAPIDPPRTVMPEKIARRRWTYPGRCIEVILQPIMAADQLNVNDMMDDLLDAFQKFKLEVADQQANQKEPISV